MKITFEKMQDMDYALTESYNSFRTNLQFCGDDIKVVMFTSCTPNEGKSTVCLNLCRSLAEDGKKVVLIDGDLRKSVLVGRHGVRLVDNETNPNGQTAAELQEKHGGKIPGLSHLLSGQEKKEQTLFETNIDGMFCMFAGHEVPNPTELLGHKYFQSLMKELRQEFDYVIIDAPPLGSVIDAAIISKVSDGAVIVVENNKVSRKFVQNIKKQLEKAECRILGTVLNKVDMNDGGYYNGYYKGYYSKYGQYGKYQKNEKYGKILRGGKKEKMMSKETNTERTSASK